MLVQEFRVLNEEEHFEAKMWALDTLTGAVVLLLGQRSPAFWAPGTGSMEDSFPWTRG